MLGAFEAHFETWIPFFNWGYLNQAYVMQHVYLNTRKWVQWQFHGKSINFVLYKTVTSKRGIGKKLFPDFSLDMNYFIC